MSYSAIRCVITLILASSTATLVQAQATRTWVSGVGDDANPCSRTAPCKTFAGAISKTAAGGEISVLDPGGFGAVTITKAITLNGGGTLGGILASLTNGVIVNAGVTDTVVLRGLSIHGGGNGLNGIRYIAGQSLAIEDCTIVGFTQHGVDVSLTGAGQLSMRKSTITGGASGVRMSATSGRLTAVLSDVLIQGTVNGVHSLYGATAVSRSVISHNTGYGILAAAGSISVDSSVLSGNGTAVQADAGATVRISGSELYNNLSGFGCGGGTLASAGNNRKGGNVGGSGGVCAPNATIAIQ